MGWFSRFIKKPARLAGAPAAPTVISPAPTSASVTAAKSPGPRPAAHPSPVPLVMVPVVTEKATQGAAAGQYTFLVDSAVNKIAVRQAVAERYGVAPRRVAVVNVPSRSVRFGQIRGRRPGFKKAIVTLPPGTKIEPEKAT